MGKQIEKLIVNTEMHLKTALMAHEFGDGIGAAWLCPIRGERPGDGFILDRAAVRELRDTLTAILEGGA